MRSDFNLMKRYAEITSKDPNSRMNTLCEFVSNFQRLKVQTPPFHLTTLYYSNNTKHLFSFIYCDIKKTNNNNRLTPKLLQELESWKLRVSPYPLDITARFIEERTVHFGNGQNYMMEKPGMFFIIFIKQTTKIIEFKDHCCLFLFFLFLNFV
jgi:hypothetical protein